MNAATHAVLNGWRDVIAAEIPALADEVTAAQGVLALAEIAAGQEAARVRDIVETFAPLDRRDGFTMATALRDRLTEAARSAPAVATFGHAAALESAQARLADAQAALDQLDVLLRPPSLALVVAEDGQAAVQARPPSAYEPIIMPMRAAG